MLIKEFIEKFEERIPKNLQESWDNSGHQIGDVNEELKGILTCVDLTEEVIEEAHKLGANFIICHHPILFRPINSIDFDYFISKKIINAIKKDLVVYASHTAIDANKNGLNAFVFKEMGFRSFAKLVPSEDGHGYGDVTDTPSRKVSHFADQIKERLDIDHVVFYGDEDVEVSKIALVTGSGASFIKECVNLGIELYITSDVKHHEAMDALEQGIMVMDIGHYESEKLFNKLAAKISKEIWPDGRIFSESKVDKYRRNII